MKPRAWLLLSLLLACGLFAATASLADAGVLSRPKSPANSVGPIAERILLSQQDSVCSVFADYESDSSDLHLDPFYPCSSLGRREADHFFAFGESGARGGAPSLLSQGVRLQI